MLPHLKAVRDFDALTNRHLAPVQNKTNPNYSEKSKRFHDQIIDLFGAEAGYHPELIGMLDKIEWSENAFMREHEPAAIMINQLMLEFMERPESFPAWRVLKLLNAAKALYESARKTAAAFDTILIEKRLQELKEISVKLSFSNEKPTWRG